MNRRPSWPGRRKGGQCAIRRRPCCGAGRRGRQTCPGERRVCSTRDERLTCTQAWRAKSAPLMVLQALSPNVTPTTIALREEQPAHLSGASHQLSPRRNRLTARASGSKHHRGAPRHRGRGERHGVACHDAQTSLRPIGGAGEGIDGRYLQRELNSTDTGQVDGQAEEVGPAGQGREGPGEGQRKMELIGGLLLFGEEHNRIFEGEEERGSTSARGGGPTAHRTLPRGGGRPPDLAQGVCFDEMAFVVDVETVIDGVILQIWPRSRRHVDGCHRAISLMGDVARPGRVLTRGRIPNARGP